MMAELIGRANEYPYNPNDRQEAVDLANNLKAIMDFKAGNVPSTDWIHMATKYPDEPKSASTLDSLLQHLIIPPPGGDYGPDTTY